MNSSIFLLFFLVLEVIFTKRIIKRVIEGEDAPEDKYQWAVSIKGDLHEDESVSACGATFIHKQWLLSAAHCFYATDGSVIHNQTDPSLWHIRAGSRKLQTKYNKNEDNDKSILNESWHENEDGEKEGDNFWENLLENLKNDDEFNSRWKRGKKIGNGHIHMHIDKIFLHPKYRGGEIEWDIALMKLKEPIKEKYLGKLVEIIDLPKKSDSKKWPKKGQKCVLVGWGCKSHEGGVAEEGQLALLSVLTNEYCEEIYDQSADLNQKHEFCAGSVKSGHGVCEGDSGSGLACKKNSKWVLAGVASATHGENPANFPGLFTRVSHFIPWIKKVIRKN